MYMKLYCFVLQFNQTCIAGAVNETVCVWRLKDGKAVTEKFPELITTLQWKPKQKDGRPKPPPI